MLGNHERRSDRELARNRREREHGHPAGNALDRRMTGDRRSRGVLAAITGTMGIMGVLVLSVAACEDRTRAERTAAIDDTPADAEIRTQPVPPAGEGSEGIVLVGDTRRETASEDSASRVVPVSYHEAENVFRTGEYGKAADLFHAYTLRKPKNPWGFYMVGLSAWRAGDFERAEKALRRTVEIDSTHRKGLLNLARVLLDRGEPSAALEYVEQVVELGPKLSEGWRVLGNVRAELAMTREATEAYRSALVLNHEDAWSMNNLALIMIRAGRYEEAVPPLARATELRPDVAVFQNNLGIALERTGHLAAAAAAFGAALEIDPEYEKARVSLARVEPRVSLEASVSVDLTALAGEFAATINEWMKPRDS